MSMMSLRLPDSLHRKVRELGVCRKNAKRTDSQCDFFHFRDDFGNFTNVPKKKGFVSRAAYSTF